MSADLTTTREALNEVHLRFCADLVDGSAVDDALRAHESAIRADERRKLRERIADLPIQYDSADEEALGNEFVYRDDVLALLDAEAGAAPPEPTPVMPNPRQPLPCGAVDAITRGRCMLDYGHEGAHGFSPEPTHGDLATRLKDAVDGLQIVLEPEDLHLVDAVVDAITALEGTPHA